MSALRSARATVEEMGNGADPHLKLLAGDSEKNSERSTHDGSDAVAGTTVEVLRVEKGFLLRPHGHLQRVTNFVVYFIFGQ